MNAHSNPVGFQLSGALRPLWSLVRVPVVGLLLLFSPVVDAVCGALLLLGLFVSVAFKISGAGAGFPFWSMIALSLGFGLSAIFYHALVGMLSR